MIVAAFGLGLFTIAAQTVLLREYLILFRGSELALGCFFAAWFGWVALSAGIARRTGPFRPGTLLALQPVASILALVSIMAVRPLFGVRPYEPSSPLVLLVGAIVGAFPVSVLTGLAFPGLCTTAGSNRGYVAETLGAVIGGMAATALAHLDGLLTISVAGLLEVMASWPIASRERGGRHFVVIALVLMVLVLVPPTGPVFRANVAGLRLASSLEAATLLSEDRTPYQLVTTAQAQGQVVLLADGAVVAAFPPGADVEMRAALLACQPGKREKAVVFGQARLDLAMALARYFRQVDLVAQDGTASEAMGKAWQLADRSPLPGHLRLVTRDPRVYAREATQADLVVVAEGEPSTMLLNRLYTVEFYQDVARMLAPSGVLATSVISAENFLGTELLRYGQSVYATMAAVFGAVVVVPGDRALLLASLVPGQATADPKDLASRYRAFSERPIAPEAFASAVLPERVEFARAAYSQPPPSDIVNRDSRPLAPFLHLLAFMRESGTGGTRLLWGLKEAGLALPFMLLGLAAVLAARGRLRSGGKYAASWLVAVAGGTSIATSVALLAAYQSVVGALYGEVGAATALSMGGLALGAFAARPLAHRRWCRVAYPVVAAAILVVLPPILDKAQGLDQVLTRVVFGALFLLLGALCGAAWPLSGGFVSGTEGERAALLESADHLGAGVSAFLAGVLVLSLFGITGTFHILAGLNSVAFMVTLADMVAGTDTWRRFRLSMVGKAIAPEPAFMSGVAIFVALAAVVTWHATRPNDVVRRLSSEDLARFESFTNAEARSSPFEHHVLDGVGATPYGQPPPPDGRAFAVASQAVAPSIEGYGGPLNLFVSVGSDGRTRRVGMVAHSETPAYVRDLPAFLERFQGIDVRTGCNPQPSGVDVMTGATVTREAVTAAVTATCRAMASGVLGLDVPAAQERPWWYWFVDVRVVVVLCLILGVIAVHMWSPGTLRVWWLALVAVVGGAMFNVSLSADRLVALAEGRLPSLLADPSSLVLVVGALALAILFGPVWCSHGCPFGAAQELLSRAARSLSLGSSLPSTPVRAIKYAILVTLAVLPFASNKAAYLAWDPLPVAFSLRLDGTSLAVIVLIALGCLVVFRFWCMVFCPVGAFLSLFNRVAGLLRLGPKHRYAACDLGVRGTHDIGCLQCNRCVREFPIRATPGNGRQLASRTLVLLTAATIVWSLLTAAGTEVPAPGASPGVRAVDMERVEGLIRDGHLSDHEARFYEPVGR